METLAGNSTKIGMRLQGQRSRLSEQELLSYAAMEGLPIPPHASDQSQNRKSGLYRLVQGMVLLSAVTLAAVQLEISTDIPLMLWALLLGMSCHFIIDNAAVERAVEFSVRRLLRIGIALLGLRITWEEISSLGILPVACVLAGTLSTIALGYVVGRMLGLGGRFGILSGSAVGICGASAALAVASVMPNWAYKERDTILTVVVVTALSTVAMLLYPLIVALFEMDDIHAAIFIGGAIHDVAQVVGAGYMVSPEVGNMSAYVKLLRVGMLLPIAVTIGFFAMRGQVSPGRLPIPLFLIGFAMLVALNSLVTIPEAALDAAGLISRYCLAIAIVALGAKTSIKALWMAGWRPLTLITFETVWIALLVSAGAYFML